MRPLYLQIPIIFCLFMLGCTSEENLERSQDSALIGDVAQISLSCIDVEKSLEFYKKLNYSILEVRLDVQTPWAFLSDGSQLFMLSQNEFPSPALTFYGKSLPVRLKKLQALGLDIEPILDQKGQLKSAVVNNPTEIGITLIDFDTNLLLKPVRHPDFTLGNFAAIKIPVSDLNEALIFWKKMDFKTLTMEDVPYSQVLHEQIKLQLHLLQGSTFARAALCYTHQNEENVIINLKNAQIDFEKVLIDQRFWLFFESPDKQLFMIELVTQPNKE